MRLRGVIYLLITTILWGSSFPFIKLSVSTISSYAYTWIRGLIAVSGLSPYVVYHYRKGFFDKNALKGGLLAGIAYMLGLWLQGLGTRYTSASNSAFITSLNVIFVHLYVALYYRKYTVYLLLSLILSITGLYLFTSPTGGFNIGDLIVLLGAVAWALQVIIVSKYSRTDPLIFTFYELLPSLAMIIPWALTTADIPSPSSLVHLLYLGLVCSDIAFTLQVMGQRNVTPSTAATVFLLEPVFASLFAYLILSEQFPPAKLAGAVLILAGLYLAIKEEEVLKHKQ